MTGIAWGAGVAVVAIGIAFGAGWKAASDRCAARTQAAIVSALTEASRKTNAALQAAQDAAIQREKELAALQSEVDAYEARSDDACVIGADDSRRLSNIK